MNQVIALEVKVTFGEVVNTIYPTILKDDKELILADCGYPHFLPHIKAAAEAKGINIDNLTKIVITHNDYDHMGALAEFKAAYPNISIVSSEIEAEYISGRKKSLRLQRKEAELASLPESERPGAENYINMLKSVEHVDVDMPVKDHATFPWCGGTEIIATPGHMPGHICVYVKEFKTLISGDALTAQNGELHFASPIYTLDLEEARRSVKKMLDYDIETVICYHGGVCTQNVREAMEKMV